MKKIITYLLILSMLFGCLSSAEAAGAKTKITIENFDLSSYRADEYLRKGSVCNNIIEMLVKGENLPSQVIVRELNSDGFQKSVKKWEISHLLDRSPYEIAQGEIDKKGYYEAILLSIFISESKLDNSLFDMGKNITAETNQIFSVLKSWVKKADEIEMQALSENQKISQLSSTQKKQLKKQMSGLFEKQHPLLAKSGEIAGTFNEIFSSVNTVYEAVNKMAYYTNACELSNQTKNLIQLMYEECPKSNLPLREALKELKDSMDGFNSGIKAKIQSVAIDQTSNVFSTLADAGWEEVLNVNPYIAAFSFGGKIGTKIGDSICNTLFSTDKTIEQYEKMRCLGEFQSLLGSSAQKLGKKYQKNRTSVNAENYFAVIDALFAVANLSCKFGVEYADILYNDASLGWMTISQQKYSEFVSDINSIQKVYVNEQKNLITGYLASLKVDYPQVYKKLNLKEKEKLDAYDSVKYFAYVKNRDGKMGYINERGEEIIKCQYDIAFDFGENGLAKVGKANGFDEEGKTVYRYGYINENGKEVIPCIYDVIWDLEKNGLFECAFDGKYGIINENGEEIVACKYNAVSFPRNVDNKEPIGGLLCAEKWKGIDTYLFFNEKGEMILTCQYDYAGWFRNGLAVVKKGKKAGYVNERGKEVIPLQYDWGSMFGKNGLSLVGKNEKTWIINKSGDKVVKCKKYYLPGPGNIGFEDNGLASVYSSENGKYGWINPKGEEVIGCQYDSTAGKFKSNGLAWVKKNKKYGYVNVKGEEVIPCKYDCAFGFYDNGLAVVEIDSVWGCINSEGEVIVPFIYDSIYGPDYGKRYDYTGGLRALSYSPNLWVIRDGKEGIVDETGAEIIPCKYEELGAADEKGFLIGYKESSADGKLEKPVLLKLTGEEVIPERYQTIGEFGEDDLAAVYDGHVCSYVDRSGNVVKKLSDKYIEAGPLMEIIY